MIEDTVSKLEAQLREARNLSPERRDELLQLLGVLKAEVAELSKTNREEAQSVARFAELSALEATRSAKNQKLQDLSLEGFKSSVEGFERSHPRLVQVVDSISRTLSNLGI
jgi:ABC-type transporter Mla subunit MlaD